MPKTKPSKLVRVDSTAFFRAIKYTRLDKDRFEVTFSVSGQPPYVLDQPQQLALSAEAVRFLESNLGRSFKEPIECSAHLIRKMKEVPVETSCLVILRLI